MSGSAAGVRTARILRGCFFICYLYAVALWISLPGVEILCGEGFPVGETRRKYGPDFRAECRDRLGRSGRRIEIDPTRDALGLCPHLDAGTGNEYACPAMISMTGVFMVRRGNLALLSRCLKGYSDER